MILNFNNFTKYKGYYIFKYHIYTIRFNKIKNGFCLSIFKEKSLLDTQYFMFNDGENPKERFLNYARAMRDTLRVATEYLENFKAIK